MYRLIEAIHDLIVRHLIRKAERIMKLLYPDDADRAAVHLYSGAEILETLSFGDGETIASVSIFPQEDGGYYIEALTPEEVDI